MSLSPSVGCVGRPARRPAGQNLRYCPKLLPAILSRHLDSCPSSGVYKGIHEHFEEILTRYRSVRDDFSILLAGRREFLDQYILIGINTDIASDEQCLLDDFYCRKFGILQQRQRGRLGEWAT